MHGFNKSINLALNALTDEDQAVSVLNDDVVLGPYFFEKNVNVLQSIATCGVACPATVHDKTYFLTSPHPPNVHRMKRREGWAYTIRKDLLDLIPRVPHQKLKTFCGDDWIFWWTHKLGYFWYKDESNVIFHHEGATVKPLRLNRTDLAIEKATFAELIKQIG